MATRRVSPQPGLGPTSGGIEDGSATVPEATLDPAAVGVLEPETITSALMAVLSRYPEAPVAALRTEGLFVAMPPWFPIGRHPLLQARSGIDLVVPDVEPAAPVAFDLFDVRTSHGVHMLVITAAGSVSTAVVASRREFASAMPRFATMRKNERGVVLEVDEATTQILGRSAEDLVGGRTLSFTHPDDRALAIESWMEMLATPGPARRVRVRIQRRDQSWEWYEVTNHKPLSDPDHRCVVSGMLDISEEMAAGEALRAREQLLDRLAEARHRRRRGPRRARGGA